MSLCRVFEIDYWKILCKSYLYLSRCIIHNKRNRFRRLQRRHHHQRNDSNNFNRIFSCFPSGPCSNFRLNTSLTHLWSFHFQTSLQKSLFAISIFPYRAVYYLWVRLHRHYHLGIWRYLFKAFHGWKYPQKYCHLNTSLFLFHDVCLDRHIRLDKKLFLNAILMRLFDFKEDSIWIDLNPFNYLIWLTKGLRKFSIFGCNLVYIEKFIDEILNKFHAFLSFY